MSRLFKYKRISMVLEDSVVLGKLHSIVLLLFYCLQHFVTHCIFSIFL